MLIIQHHMILVQEMLFFHQKVLNLSFFHEEMKFVFLEAISKQCSRLFVEQVICCIQYHFLPVQVYQQRIVKDKKAKSENPKNKVIQEEKLERSRDDSHQQRIQSKETILVNEEKRVQRG